LPDIEERQAAPRARLVRTFLILALIVLPVQIGGTLAARMVAGDFTICDYTCAYLPVAQSLAHGGGPVLEGAVLTKYPVGYPAYLAGLVLTSETTGVPLDGLVVACNFLWNLATMGGVFLLGSRVAGVRVGAAAAVLVGICPHLLFVSRTGYSQVPCWALEVWGIYCAYSGYYSGKRRWLALAGLLLGLAALCRAETMALTVILAICLAASSRHSLRARLAQVMLIVAVFALTTAPWIVYLYEATGKFMLLTGRTITVATVHNTYGAVSGLGHLEAWAAAPLSYSVEMLKHAVMAWYRADNPSQTGLREAVAGAAILPYLILTVVGFCVAFRRRGIRWITAVALTTILSTWAISTVTYYIARLTVGGLVLFAFVPGMGAVWVLEKTGILARKPLAETPEIAATE
jgi:4-amino-4-deoxy-L-arabinose transferase-like glycosyltransferase